MPSPFSDPYLSVTLTYLFTLQIVTPCQRLSDVKTPLSNIPLGYRNRPCSVHVPGTREIIMHGQRFLFLADPKPGVCGFPGAQIA